MRVLVVEDERRIAALLGRGLRGGRLTVYGRTAVTLSAIGGTEMPR